MVFLFITAGFIIAVLTGIAIYYHVLLRRQRQKEVELAADIAKAQERARNSIRVLASAMLEGQVTYTEASIRISVLLNGAGLDESEQADYSVFAQLAAATAHIPILDAWKALSKKEKRAYDAEREKLEAKYKDFIDPVASKLIVRLSD
ncbi:DUF2489 domain-containing protein [Teredinibacter turnerae]|uniref:DUF2489 domain-containing protein n=1 Tax=Teredinibacter turnerae TaxID=2426 RepID=UPI00037B83C4|nr:DUF2489 domain-containing protein [Teredinibacter turnerae]